MPKEGFLAKFGHTRTQFLVILLVILNAFTWYFVAFEILVHMLDTANITPNEILMIWTIHFGGVTCAVLVGATLSNRFISRNNLLSLWMFLGVVFSLVPTVIGTTLYVSIAAISLLFGVAFGLGMPSCMAYYADFTAIDKRGRVGGIIYFAIGIGTFLLLVVLLPSTRLVEQLMILAIWRGFGLATFLILGQKNRLKVTKTPSYVAILCEKPLLLYLVPWIMFCLVNSLTSPIFPPDIVSMSTIIGSVIAGLFALVGGLFSDSVGRKRVAITGFVMLGIGYATLGIFPENLVSYYLFSIVDGIAWGMFGAVFLMVLWGDLSRNMMPEKYYAIGGLPYLLSGFLGILVAPYVRELISESTTFSFASLFLFLAVLPLLFAPETLPKKVIKKRRLRKYLDDVKKVKKEYERDSSD